MYPLTADYTHFLKPAHKHDPISLPSSILLLPETFLTTLSPTIRYPVLAIQETVSILSASHDRLLELLDEKFNRLVPLSSNDLDENGDVHYSEPAFFAYARQVSNEKWYLTTEVIPNWEYQASHVRTSITQHCDRIVQEWMTTLAEWWTKLEGRVEAWIKEIQGIDVPTFKGTVRMVRFNRGMMGQGRGCGEDGDGDEEGGRRDRIDSAVAGVQ